MMTVAVILLSILSLVLLYLVYNLTSKLTKLKEFVEQGDKDLYAAVNVVAFCNRIVSETFATLIQVDKRGGFRSDDEVGFAFKAIFECVQQTKSALENLTKLNQDGNSGADSTQESKE